jgi:quinolinate synthase
MKRITLQNIYDSLRLGRHEVTVDPAIATKARRAIQRMLDLPKPARAAQFDPRAAHAAVHVI